MNTFVKVGMIGGAAWYLFHENLEAMFPGVFGKTSSSTTNTPAATTTSTTPVQTGTIPASSNTTRSLLAAAAQKHAAVAQNGMFDGYHWAFMYREVRGVDPALTLADPARLMTLDEFMAALGGAGLSGVSAAPAKRRTAAARAWGY